MHGLLWDPLFQEGQKAPGILAVGKGSAHSKPSVFATARLVECLGGITECLALYMCLS